MCGFRLVFCVHLLIVPSHNKAAVRRFVEYYTWGHLISAQWRANGKFIDYNVTSNSVVGLPEKELEFPSRSV